MRRIDGHCATPPLIYSRGALFNSLLLLLLLSLLLLVVGPLLRWRLFFSLLYLRSLGVYNATAAATLASSSGSRSLGFFFRWSGWQTERGLTKHRHTSAISFLSPAVRFSTVRPADRPPSARHRGPAAGDADVRPPIEVESR